MVAFSLVSWSVLLVIGLASSLIGAVVIGEVLVFSVLVFEEFGSKTW